MISYRQKKQSSSRSFKQQGYMTTCVSGSYCSCPTWGTGCTPALDRYTAVNTSVLKAGQPYVTSLFGGQPEIYTRSGALNSTQYVALRWGLEYKSRGIMWDDWFYGMLRTDSFNDTSFAAFGNWPNMYAFWNASNTRHMSSLGFSSDFFTGPHGLWAGDAYRLRLSVVWYNTPSNVGIAKQSDYIVPFNGYPVTPMWDYFTGYYSNGDGSWRIAP